MAQQMKSNDETRIRLLASLIKKNSVTANISQIKKNSKLHKATIKTSIDFLMKEGIIGGFGPKISLRGLGYKLEVMQFLQIDLTEKESFDKFIGIAKNDQNLYRLSAVLGSGTWNFLARHIYPDVDSFHRAFQKKYLEKVPHYHDLVRNQQIFYATEPYYKQVSRTRSVLIDIMEKNGWDAEYLRNDSKNEPQNAKQKK